MAHKAMKPLLKKHPKMDVLFCAEDRLAMGAMICMLEKGRSCPDDIAIFGVGNNRSITEEFIPSISSIDFEGEEIGRRAYFKLVDQSEAKDVKGRYIKRESTSL
jgi:DNA-binding LacI/PurR family transcriptional regulator